MKVLRTLSSFLLFNVLFFSSWIVIGIITVLIGVAIGIRPSRIILGVLGFLTLKWSWNISKKLRHQSGGKHNPELKKKISKKRKN